MALFQFEEFRRVVKLLLTFSVNPLAQLTLIILADREWIQFLRGGSAQNLIQAGLPLLMNENGLAEIHGSPLSLPSVEGGSDMTMIFFNQAGFFLLD
jgi:hypothetical protein